MALHLFQTSPPISSTQVITRKGQRMTLLSQKDLYDPQRHGEWIRAYCPIHGSDHQRSLSINPTTGFGVCFCCQINVLVKEFNPEAAATLLRQAYGEHLSRCDPSSSLKHAPLPDSQPPPIPSVSKTRQERESQVLRQLYAQGALSLQRSEAWGAQAYL